MSEEAIVPPLKLDPESLAIRARPARAIRFKRGAIVGITAIGSVSLIAVTWMALSPNMLRHGAPDEQLSQPNGRVATDVLNGVPAGYGDVPKLGPPLPGDLGKPILEHERSAAVQPASGETQQAQQAQAEELSRRAAEVRAARESGVLVQSGARAATAPEAVAPSPANEQAGLGTPRAALDPDHDPNAQGHKAEFVATHDTGGAVNSHALERPASPYMLSAGSVISASLITGLRSDLPGLVTAQVTENVYDSATGRFLLVPQGARLVGSYDSVVAFGQKRALVVWQRIILPDGSSLQIDNVPATDPAGYAGLQDKVDFHTWSLLKGIVMSTLLGVSTQLALSGQSDLVQVIRMSTQDSVARAGDQITQRNLGVQPTITIRPGAPVRLVVHRDLVLARWGQ